MKASEVKKRIQGVEQAQVKNGVYKVRQGFFYRFNKDSGDLVAKVVKAFPNAIILDQGEVWKPFRGGDSIAQGSHWYVDFKLPEPITFFRDKDENKVCKDDCKVLWVAGCASVCAECRNGSNYQSKEVANG